MTLALGILMTAALPVPAGQCFAAARDIAAGAVLVAADTAPVPCGAGRRPPLGYDQATGSPVAAAAIPAGTYLGRLAPFGAQVVPAGTELTLRSSAGPVIIERRVTVVRAGRSGERVFVRASSGEVFAAPLVLDAR